jgi:hypothetical protein
MSVFHECTCAGTEYLHYCSTTMTFDELSKYLVKLRAREGASGAVPLVLARQIYPTLRNSETCEYLEMDAAKNGFTTSCIGRDIIFKPLVK